MAADWLANFSDYRVTTKLRELRTQRFWNNLMTSKLIVTKIRQSCENFMTILRLFYDVL